MKYITVQPDNIYFKWQLIILHKNMQEMGMLQDAITIIGYTGSPSEWAIEYSLSHDNVYLIEDTRGYRRYSPSIRPHLLAKYFKQNPLYERWMYHDCDILFTNKVDWNSIVQDDRKVYLSNTVSYIGAEYVLSKSEELFNRICQVAGIDPEVVKENQPNSGGAQYLFGKDIVIDWKRVEFLSNSLHRLMEDTKHIYSPESPIQSWTADMKGILYHLWSSGYTTKIIPEMEFSWPSNLVDDFNKYNIFHNSGVMPQDTVFFNKSYYRETSPFEDDFSFVSPEFCSFKYVEFFKKLPK